MKILNHSHTPETNIISQLTIFQLKRKYYRTICYLNESKTKFYNIYIFSDWYEFKDLFRTSYFGGL